MVNTLTKARWLLTHITQTNISNQPTFLRVLAQPRGGPLASLLVGVAATIALLHLAVPPRGLLRVLLEPTEPLFVRPAEQAARVLRPKHGSHTHTNHGDPANLAPLDAVSVYVGNSALNEGTYILRKAVHPSGPPPA